MKKFSLILMSALLFLGSCNSNKSNNNNNNGNSNNESNNQESQTGGNGQNNDTLDIFDNSFLLTNSDYSIDLSNQSKKVTVEKGKKNKIDYESKKEYEEKILSYIKYFGVNSFRLPDAYSYSDDYFTGGVFIEGIQESPLEYYKYLNEVFKDFKKTYMDFGSLGDIASELGLNGLDLSSDEKIDINMDTFDYSITTNFEKEMDYLTYKVSVNITSEYITIGVSPSNNDYWTYEGQMGGMNNLPFFETINCDVPRKITLKGHQSYYERVDGKLVSEIKEATSNIYYLDDGSIIMMTTPKSSEWIYYQKVADTFKKYYVREDMTLRVASEDFTERRMAEDLKIYLIDRLIGYTGVCRQVSSVYREKSDMLDYYEQYVPEGYEIFDDKLCIKLKTGTSGWFRCEYPHELLLDTETGYIMKYTLTDNKYTDEQKKLFNTETSVKYGSFKAYVDENEKLQIKEVYDTSTFNVKFQDEKGKLLKEANVIKNGGVMAPDAPVKENYDFVGWSSNYKRITENVIIKPVYKQIPQHTVIFKDEKGNELKRETVYERDKVDAPIYNPSSGVFYNWNADTSYITKDMVVEPIILSNTQYKVSFYDLNENLLKEEMVVEGKDATAPEAPKVEGYTFIGWSCNYKEVMEDLDVCAIYSKDGIDASYGSISYFLAYHLSKIENMQPEERYNYMMEIGDRIALASSSNVVNDAMLNEGKAVALIYPHAHILNSYGALLVKAGYEKTALDYFENAVKLDPYNPVYYINLAEMLYKAEVTSGREDFEHVNFLINEALKYNQVYGPALQLKTTVMLKEGRVDESLEYLFASAKYIWNDTSIHHFNSLIDEINRGYSSAVNKARYTSTRDDYVIDFTNPIEPYLDTILEIANIQTGNCEGIEINGNNPIYVPVTAYADNVDAFQNVLDKMEKELTNSMMSVDKNLLNQYLGSSGNNVSLVDSRTFMMARLVSEYYKQKLEIALNEYSLYGTTDIENFEEHHGDVDMGGLEAELIQASELDEDAAFDRIKAILSKYFNGVNFNKIQFLKDELSSYEDFFNDAVAEMYVIESYKDGVKNEAYEQFVHDLLPQAYYDVTYCASGLYNSSLQNYIYAKVYQEVFNIYDAMLGRAIGVGMDLAFFEITAKECIKLGYKMLLGTDKDSAQFMQDPEPEPVKPQKGKDSGDVFFGLSWSIGDVSFGVSYSLGGKGELSFDSPYMSASYQHDWRTGNSTSTTLYYGLSAGNDVVMGSIQSRVQDKVFGDVIPCYSALTFVSSDSRLGYGTQITRNSEGKIIESAKITSVSGSSTFGGESGVNVTSLYKHDSISSSVSLDSIKIETNYHGITTSVDLPSF